MPVPTAQAKPPIPATAERLKHLFAGGTRPILWIDHGLSVAAGHPSENDFLSILRAEADDPIPESAPLTEVVDRFVAGTGHGALAQLLHRTFGARHPPTRMHHQIARVCRAGLVKSIVTTNYDPLVEDALSAAGVAHVVQTLENNAVIGPGALRVLKVHGSYTDWAGVVASGRAMASFPERYSFLVKQLDVDLQRHPIVFLGSAMHNRRILDWLDGLDERFASLLERWRPMMTEAAWQRALATPYRDGTAEAPLSKGNIRPLIFDDEAHLSALWAEVVEELAPLQVEELVFQITARRDTWTVAGPTDESPAREVDNPLRATSLRRDLREFRARVGEPVASSDNRASGVIRELYALAVRIGAVLADTLFDADARSQVLRRINDVDRGRARLSLRARDTEFADLALALPWELVTPKPGRLAVREGELDVVREAILDGAPGADTADRPMSLAVLVSAPADLGALEHQDEIARLKRTLEPLDHQLHIAAGGALTDLLTLAQDIRPVGLHFTGHGLPGQLLFTGADGQSEPVAVESMARKIRQRLVESGTPRAFPRLFFLASCHSLSEPQSGVRTRVSDHLDENNSDLGPNPPWEAIADGVGLGTGPATAATLHRAGFAHVIGYFGPVGQAVCTRAEVAFYQALARGQTLLQAAALARASMGDKLVTAAGNEYLYPLGWAQIAVYHRGDDVPLARSPSGPPADQPTSA